VGIGSGVLLGRISIVAERELSYSLWSCETFGVAVIV